jgi:hypothetical protein
MSTHSATPHVETRARTTTARQVIVSLLGPTTALAGVAWAIVQPWRVTLLHPHGESFWWLFVQPPIWIVLAGLGFHVFVARPLLDDLDA